MVAYEPVFDALAIQHRIRVVDVHENFSRRCQVCEPCNCSVRSAHWNVADGSAKGSADVSAAQLGVAPERAVYQNYIARAIDISQLIANGCDGRSIGDASALPFQNQSNGGLAWFVRIELAGIVGQRTGQRHWSATHPIQQEGNTGKNLHPCELVGDAVEHSHKRIRFEHLTHKMRCIDCNGLKLPQEKQAQYLIQIRAGQKNAADRRVPSALSRIVNWIWLQLRIAFDLNPEIR